MNVLDCLYVYCLCPWRSKDFHSTRTGDTEGCEPPCLCWELCPSCSWHLQVQWHLKGGFSQQCFKWLMCTWMAWEWSLSYMVVGRQTWRGTQSSSHWAISPTPINVCNIMPLIPLYFPHFSLILWLYLIVC